MAALTGTLAGSQQGLISFTRQNEEEADRIGIQVLQRSGFDPQAMPAFMGKLLDESRYSTRTAGNAADPPLTGKPSRRRPQPCEPDAPGCRAVLR